MDYIFNNPKYKRRRKELRNNLGLPEILLWNQLKNSKLGVKFRRQYGVGAYIIDFYCHGNSLGIELDGETHNNSKAQEYDKTRTEYIFNQNIKIIRFQNVEVLNNLNGVVEEIKKYIV
ncbi:MAG: endonuclease domain-containing protein [Candidatus Doudnabacteria bacterium]|nr:endonuclease domain-containing protein [Candidatus Doudnabacteria bacterium]